MDKSHALASLANAFQIQDMTRHHRKPPDGMRVPADLDSAARDTIRQHDRPRTPQNQGPRANAVAGSIPVRLRELVQMELGPPTSANASPKNRTGPGSIARHHSRWWDDMAGFDSRSTALQVVLDCAWTQEQLGSDLRIGHPLMGRSGDLSGGPRLTR
jgi:hypothetical protein